MQPTIGLLQLKQIPTSYFLFKHVILDHILFCIGQVIQIFFLQKEEATE